MLGVRVVSAILAIFFLILVFWVGSWQAWIFDLFLVFVALIGMREVYNAFAKKGILPQNIAGYQILIFFYLQRFLFIGKYDFLYIMIAIVFLLSILVWKTSVKPIDIAVTILGVFYPGILLMVAGFIKETAFVHPYYLLYLSLTAAYGSDTFAYFVGSYLGKRKLCPAISPNKTIEGSIGGLAGGIILVILLGFILNWVYNINVPPIHFAIIGLLGGIFSQLGDLTASTIKRYCDVKDFGNIMPGHGGIMDRIDSLIFVLPVVYAYSQLFLVG